VTEPAVLLVNPPITEAQRRGPLGAIIKNSLQLAAPVACIASHRAAGVRVGLMDAAVEGQPQTRRWADPPWRPTGRHHLDLELLRQRGALATAVKRSAGEVATLIGGPHVSTQAEHAMQFACFDYACIGEGEVTTLELVRALSAGAGVDGVKGLALRRDGKLHRTEPRPMISDLDRLPFPARHLLPLAKYVPQPNDGSPLKLSTSPAAAALTAASSATTASMAAPTNSFSAGRIVDEMEELVGCWGEATSPSSTRCS
jgi:hypothetical protein